MSRSPLCFFVLLALIGAAIGLQCHYYQSGNNAKDSTINCTNGVKYCYKYVVNGKDGKGKKYEDIYEGCSGDGKSPIPTLGFGIGPAATCDKDGKRAQSSGSTVDGSFDDAYYCCSKDGCNSAGYTTTSIGLSLVTVIFTVMKAC